MTFVKPEVVDYGTLNDLTQATAIGGIEDGASKNDTEAHHSIGQSP